MFCQNILGIDRGWLTDRPSVNVMGENGNSYDQGNGDLLMHLEYGYLLNQPTPQRSHLPLTLPYLRAFYLCYLQHLGVESVEMEHELSQTNECQLDGEHLTKGPVISGIGERVKSPFLQHASGHHVSLHLL